MMTDQEKLLKIVTTLDEKKAAQRVQLEEIKATPAVKSILALEERVKKLEALIETLL